MSNPAPNGSPTVARDELFDALSDADRRAVLRLVDRHSPDGIGKDDLAFQLAAVMLDKQLVDVTDDDHQRALVELHHRLLPQLTDAGLLTETDDGSIVVPHQTAAEISPLEDFVSGHRDVSEEALDAIFRALADGRRRTVLSVLSDQYHPIGIETLARDVAAREAGTSGREVSQDRVDDVQTSLAHVHLPLLADATIVGYDAETAQVSYEGHPAVRVEWIRSGDGSAATGATESAGSSADGSGDDVTAGNTDVQTLEGREPIIATGQSLCERADDELFLLFTTTGLLDEGCFRRIEDAVDRGVDVYLGSRDPRVRDLVSDRVPEVVCWEPQLDWLNLPPEGESVGRLVFADREAVMLGTIGGPTPDTDEYVETAILGEGRQNGLVVLMRQMLGSRLEELDARRQVTRSEFPL